MIETVGYVSIEQTLIGSLGIREKVIVIAHVPLEVTGKIQVVVAARKNLEVLGVGRMLIRDRRPTHLSGVSVLFPF